MLYFSIKFWKRFLKNNERISSKLDIHWSEPTINSKMQYYVGKTVGRVMKFFLESALLLCPILLKLLIGPQTSVFRLLFPGLLSLLLSVFIACANWNRDKLDGIQTGNVCRDSLWSKPIQRGWKVGIYSNERQSSSSFEIIHCDFVRMTVRPRIIAFNNPFRSLWSMIGFVGSRAGTDNGCFYLSRHPIMLPLWNFFLPNENRYPGNSVICFIKSREGKRTMPIRSRHPGWMLSTL